MISLRWMQQRDLRKLQEGLWTLGVLSLSIAFSLPMLPGCSTSANLALNVSATATPTPTATSIPSGARAAKVIFIQSLAGSFDAPAATGTVNTPGSGLQVTRLFNADSTLLATGTSDANWPQWLTSFEIGISGTSNTAATNADCAKFSSGTESTATNCNFGGGSGTAACGAPVGQFRVSEADCSAATPGASAGSGASTDGIYLRAIFNRSTTVLGSTENILAVLEYSASTLNSAPANPTTCFSGGLFSAESCSDYVWRTYIKHSTTETVQPFLMLIPPAFSSLLATNLPTPVLSPLGSGTGVATKQIFVPLSADANITVFQISRTQSNFPSLTNLTTYCTPGSFPGNSPLCAGVIFYSLTFYRI